MRQSSLSKLLLAQAEIITNILEAYIRLYWYNEKENGNYYIISPRLSMLGLAMLLPRILSGRSTYMPFLPFVARFFSAMGFATALTQTCKKSRTCVKLQVDGCGAKTKPLLTQHCPLGNEKSSLLILTTRAGLYSWFLSAGVLEIFPLSQATQTQIPAACFGQARTRRGSAYLPCRSKQ